MHQTIHIEDRNFIFKSKFHFVIFFLDWFVLQTTKICFNLFQTKWNICIASLVYFINIHFIAHFRLVWMYNETENNLQWSMKKGKIEKNCNYQRIARISNILTSTSTFAFPILSQCYNIIANRKAVPINEKKKRNQNISFDCQIHTHAHT